MNGARGAKVCNERSVRGLCGRGMTDAFQNDELFVSIRLRNRHIS